MVLKQLYGQKWGVCVGDVKITSLRLYSIVLVSCWYLRKGPSKANFQWLLVEPHATTLLSSISNIRILNMIYMIMDNYIYTHICICIDVYVYLYLCHMFASIYQLPVSLYDIVYTHCRMYFNLINCGSLQACHTVKLAWSWNQKRSHSHSPLGKGHHFLLFSRWIWLLLFDEQCLKALFLFLKSLTILLICQLVSVLHYLSGCVESDVFIHYCSL